MRPARTAAKGWAVDDADSTHLGRWCYNRRFIKDVEPLLLFCIEDYHEDLIDGIDASNIDNTLIMVVSAVSRLGTWMTPPNDVVFVRLVTISTIS
jgi:hypothetical protein